MNCDEGEMLLHGLLDKEIEADPACRIEAHVGACPRCAAQLHGHRAMRAMIGYADLRFSAPPALRTRIKAMRPVAAAGKPYRRSLLERFAFGSAFKGFAFGSALSAAAAALLMIAVIRSDQDQVIVSDVVSAHLRSLQANHLTDVQTSDQQGVKPWLSNRLGAAPPVPDLTSQGFKLIGGRIDYVLRKGVAAIVYRPSRHVINVFLAPGADAEPRAKAENMPEVSGGARAARGRQL